MFLGRAWQKIMKNIFMSKTIFFSVSNLPVYRNFVLLPESIVHLFGLEKDLSVVLLVKKGTLADQLRARFNAPNYIIEEIKENQKKSWLGRAFFFFFSYLIFTDTTKLVSSYGVRADKPRPLWKYWNFPFKRLIASTFGRSRLVRETLVPTLYRKIFSNRPYAYLFEKYKPDLVFFANVCIWPLDMELLAEAKNWGAKSIGMPANWDHLSKYYVPFKPDKLLVWSKQVSSEAFQFQYYTKNQVKIVGAPQIDFMIKKDNFMPREEFLKKVNFPPSSRVLSFFSQGPYSLDGADLVDMILRWIQSNKLPQDLYILIRPHPSGLFEKEKYLPFRNNPKVHIDETEHWSSIDGLKYYINLLYHSDIMLTTYSSIATEASIYDRPTIIANFDGYKQRPFYQSVRRHARFTHFQYLLPLGGIKVTNSPDELCAAINAYLDYSERDHDARMRLREEVFGFFDEKNSERIRDEVINYLNL